MKSCTACDSLQLPTHEELLSHISRLDWLACSLNAMTLSWVSLDMHAWHACWRSTHADNVARKAFSSYRSLVFGHRNWCHTTVAKRAQSIADQYDTKCMLRNHTPNSGLAFGPSFWANVSNNVTSHSPWHCLGMTFIDRDKLIRPWLPQAKGQICQCTAIEYW